MLDDSAAEIQKFTYEDIDCIYNRHYEEFIISMVDIKVLFESMSSRNRIIAESLLEGSTLSEIGEVLGITPQAVYNALNRHIRPFVTNFLGLV